MADYTIFQSTTTTFAVVTGGTVLTAGAVTGTVVAAGTAKNLGSNRDTLDNSALGIAEPGLYGATVASGARVGTTVIDNSITTDSNDIGNQEAENYHMKRVASNVGKSASTSLASGASEKGSKRDKIHNVLSARMVQVATALREGKWDVYSGSFSAGPTGVNDFTDMHPDNAIANDGNNFGLKGGLTYSTAGSSVITTGTYEDKGGSTS